MSSKIFGLGTNSITPRPDFTATQDETGKWKASMSFSIRRNEYTNIKSYFYKGELLSVIYPNIDPEFAGFYIESHSVEEQPGGMDIVNVNATGWTEGSETQSERETVYDYNTSLTERSIIEHPKFKALAVTFSRDAIVGVFNGLNRWSGAAATPTITDIATGLPICTITTSPEILWFNAIVLRGVKTYKVPEAEYTETKTDIGGLTESLVENLGLIDTPPNSPVAPSGKIWQLSGVHETRSSTNPITYTRTWSTIDDDDDSELLYTE